jgi:hypothetical protein
MACSCGSNKSSATPKTFVVTTPGQSPKTYSTEVEAAAAAKRGGGTYRQQ